MRAKIISCLNFQDNHIIIINGKKTIQLFLLIPQAISQGKMIMSIFYLEIEIISRKKNAQFQLKVCQLFRNNFSVISVQLFNCSTISRQKNKIRVSSNHLISLMFNSIGHLNCFSQCIQPFSKGTTFIHRYKLFLDKKISQNLCTSSKICQVKQN